MSLVVQLEPVAGAAPEVEYRWDVETDILRASLRSSEVPRGPAGTVELEGADGSWLVLDLAGGRVTGVEVAVWPDVRARATLPVPSPAEVARMVVPSAAGDGATPSIEVETTISAEADDAGRVIHFRMGTRREARSVRVGGDLLMDLDSRSRVAGLWLLNVPPFPSSRHAT